MSLALIFVLIVNRISHAPHVSTDMTPYKGNAWNARLRIVLVVSVRINFHLALQISSTSPSEMQYSFRSITEMNFCCSMKGDLKISAKRGRCSLTPLTWMAEVSYLSESSILLRYLIKWCDWWRRQMTSSPICNKNSRFSLRSFSNLSSVLHFWGEA